MRSGDNIHKILSQALTSINIEPEDRLIDSFFIYLNELIKWNKAYNLTSIIDPVEIIYKHFIDSLLYDSFLTDKEINLCDVGTGAGFPGIPLKMLRYNLNLTLIEPSRKRCAFLHNIKTKLKLTDIEIIHDRVENIRGRVFDVIVSRALFKIPELIEKSEHILKNNGYFVISKGTKGTEELNLIDKNYIYKTKKIEIVGMSRLLIKVQRYPKDFTT